MVDCATLRENNFKAQEVLSHTALNTKLDELGKYELRSTEEFSRKIEGLENELGAAKETIPRLEVAVQGTRGESRHKAR